MDENNLNEFENNEVKEEVIESNIIEEINNEIKEDLVFKQKDKGDVNIKSFASGIIGGIVGTALVISIMFGVPSIRNNLLSTTNNEQQNSQIEQNNNAITTPIDYVEYENPVIGIADKVGSSVVGIVLEYDYYSFFGNQKATQEGSGIIIRSDGYILTNNHVIATDSDMYDNIKIKVYLANSDEPIIAEVVGTDAQTDMAVLKIDCTDLPTIEYGNSSECRVGEMVVAIGNPLGMEFAGSVSVGYISALDRKLSDSNGNTLNLMQTDAAINSGNSGGALVNTKGQLIGINTAKIQGTGVEGLGFAIPIDDVKEIIESLITNKKVIRPYLGIGGVAVDEKIARENDLVVGVYVQSIETFSAAERAGVRVGDVITEVEGIKVQTVDELNEVKNKYNVGDTIKLKINRDGKEEEISVKLQASNWK